MKETFMEENNKVSIVPVLIEGVDQEFHLIATSKVASMTDSMVRTVIVRMSEQDLKDLRQTIDNLLG